MTLDEALAAYLLAYGEESFLPFLANQNWRPGEERFLEDLGKIMGYAIPAADPLWNNLLSKYREHRHSQS